MKDFLRGICGHERRIKALMARRQHYYDIAMRGASIAEAWRAKVPGSGSCVEEAVCKLMELEVDLDAEIDRMVDETKRAEQLIAQLSDPRYRDVLRHRYLDGWTWERIADELNYEISWVFRMHGSALLALERMEQRSGKEAIKNNKKQ